MSPVDLSHDGPLAVITLDAPPLNLFDEPLVRALQDAIAAVRSSADTRGLLIRANGRAVSAGVDVKLFATLDPVSGAALWREWLAMIQSVESLPYPTVFAAHALCLTAAFELSLACDILLAAESATFGLVEIVVGLTPSMGGPQRLAERAGPARARELVYTGERYPAVVLERWNVVNRVLPDEGFAEAARAYAHRVAAGPTLAHAATKRLVATAVRDGVRAADDVVPAVSGALFATEDLRGAVQTFLKEGPGKATFTGR
jgi:enoyl-CoA hydratase/carnithine racemase